jgi:hypothetical protein
VQLPQLVEHISVRLPCRVLVGEAETIVGRPALQPDAVARRDTECVDVDGHDD